MVPSAKESYLENRGPIGIFMAEQRTRERTKRVNVRLSESIEAKASFIAEEMGIPLSTLVTVALGEYVASKARLDRSALNAAKIQGREMAQMMERKLTPEYMASVASVLGEEQQEMDLPQ